MRPLRDIKRLVSHAKVQSSPEANRRVLNDLLKELATRNDMSGQVRGHLWSSMARSRLARVAVVAALIIIATLVVVSRRPHESTGQPPHIATASVADMLTVGRLNAACRRGGWPEVERQCEQAAQKLQSRSERISIEQLIREMKGT